MSSPTSAKLQWKCQYQDVKMSHDYVIM